MVKANHTQKSVIMPTALESRLIEHVQACNNAERQAGTPRNQATTESSLVCLALDTYLLEIMKLKHKRSA